MSGFANVAQWANADEAGQAWFTQFRKTLPSATVTTSSWVDYTYYSGTPPANFYASTPLEAAYVDPTRGIYIPSVTPAKQFLKNFTCMAVSASAASTAPDRQPLILCDYLMYYPFIDTDAIGEEQTMVQSVTLPRYSAGQVMVIAQSASSITGRFTMSYTNQNGVAGRTSQVTDIQVVTGGGQSLVQATSGGGFQPFVGLQAEDSGVRSIESVTVTIAGGGLMALVIVKPLLPSYIFEACRTNAAAFGCATAVENLISKPPMPEIKDGAVLGIIGRGNGGNLSQSAIVGYIETVWN